jgi:serine/threonine protein kinase
VPGDLEPGALFGRYRIEAHVASGGMGVVYRAKDTELQRRVALKLIAPEWAQDEGLRERFKHESRLVAALDHPNVIPVHDAGERDGVLYIAMRFVEGTDLRGLIDDRGALDPHLVGRITSRVASALDAAHAAGLVHRDVKPANVLLAGGPGEEHPYLTDFGLAKRLDGDSGLTHSGQWLGTVDYVAPEQLTGQPVDHRTDVYSLAVLTFEALTGEVPFRGESGPAKMTAKLHEELPSLRERAPWLAPGLDDVIQRGMATAPEARYQSAGELGRALLSAVGPTPLPGPQPTIVPATAAPPPPPPSAPSAPSAPAAPAAPAPSPAQRTWKPRVVLIVAAAIIAATVGVLAIAGVFSGGEDPARQGSTPSSPTSPTAPGVPSSSDAEAVVKRFGAAYRAEDLDAVMATLTDDVRFVFESTRTGTVTKDGSARLRAEFATVWAATDGYRLELTGRDEAQDAVIVNGRFSQNSPLTGEKPSGTVSFEVVESGGKPLIRKFTSKVG